MSWPDSPLPFLTVPVAVEDAQVPTAPVLVSVRVIVPAVAFAVADPPGETVQVGAAPAWAGTPPRPAARAAAPAKNPAIKRVCMGLLLFLFLANAVPGSDARKRPPVPAATDIPFSAGQGMRGRDQVPLR